MISRTVSSGCLFEGIEALTREVATKEEFLRGQEIFRCGRSGDSELRRIDILYLGPDRGIRVNAICSPTSQRYAERFCSSTRGEMRQRREQSQ